MPQLQLNDLGHILEGVVERDPMSERLQLHTVDAKGQATTIDLLKLLEEYESQEVRFVLTSMESIRKVEELLGDGEGVMGVMPEDVPGATVRRTSKPE